jgi:uncharacterized cupredoxin-like copper-binding protein
MHVLAYRTSRAVRLGLTSGALLFIIIACASSDEQTSEREREVSIAMKSFAYEPARLTVEQGTTVRFLFRNPDNVVHEAIIGDEAAQREHEERAKAAEGSDAHHTAEQGVDVDPGKAAELTHTFDELGTVLIGCHEPGHYEGGMKAEVTVT